MRSAARPWARAITPGYSPPEQYGFGKTDARSDVYALGATLYTLLTGQTPPEAIDLISESQVLTPVQQINAAVSGATAQAIVAAMNPSISQRLASAARFEQALAGRAAPPASSPQPPLAARQAQQPFAAPSAAPAQAPAKPRRQRGCMLGGVAIAGLVIGALAMLALLVGGIRWLNSTSPSGTDFASTATPFVVATPDTALLSGNYVSVTDVSGALSAAAPVEWIEVDGSNWLDASGAVLGAHLTVAPSISALHSSYSAPGVDLLASAVLSDGGQADLDFYKNIYGTACIYDGRFDTSFAVYTGVYDSYSSCDGQGNIYVAAGTAADNSHVVIFQCQYTTQAELEACTHIRDSVAVAGVLPQ